MSKVNINDITPEDVEAWLMDRAEGLGVSGLGVSLYSWNDRPTWSGDKNGINNYNNSTFEQFAKWAVINTEEQRKEIRKAELMAELAELEGES